MACLEACTRQKFSMEPYKSLLKSEAEMAYVEVEGGLCWTDDHGEVKQEFLDMTSIFTDIKNGYADKAE